MKILSLVQGTDAWLEARKIALNASDAPTIMGDGYISLDEHIQIQLGMKENNISPYMQKLFDEGHKREDMARIVCELEFGVDLRPIVATETISNIELQASFDGIDIKKGFVWEHKFTNKKFMFDDIPALYYWQLEHQMLVSNTDNATLTVTDRDTLELRHYKYKSIPERRKALIKGWKNYIKARDNFEREDKEWQEAASDYLHAKDMADMWARKLSDASSVLKVLAGKNSASGCGVKVSVKQEKFKKQTPASFIKENGIKLQQLELEKPSYNYRITVNKEK